MLALDELAGFALSNRPRGRPARPADLVLVADCYPAPGVLSPGSGARVEAARRPTVVGRAGVRVSYREDDGVAERAVALARLLARRPLPCARELVAFRRPGLTALAPAALRLVQDAGTRVEAAGGPEAEATARRLAALAGAELAPAAAAPARTPES